MMQKVQQQRIKCKISRQKKIVLNLKIFYLHFHICLMKMYFYEND